MGNIFNPLPIGESGPSPNTVLLGATIVSNQNRTSICSVAFAGHGQNNTHHSKGSSVAIVPIWCIRCGLKDISEWPIASVHHVFEFQISAVVLAFSSSRSPTVGSCHATALIVCWCLALTQRTQLLSETAAGDAVQVEVNGVVGS